MLTAGHDFSSYLGDPRCSDQKNDDCGRVKRLGSACNKRLHPSSLSPCCTRAAQLRTFLAAQNNTYSNSPASAASCGRHCTRQNENIDSFSIWSPQKFFYEAEASPKCEPDICIVNRLLFLSWAYLVRRVVLYICYKEPVRVTV